MEAYIVANIKDSNNRTIGYKLLNLDKDNETLDVSKEKLLVAMQRNIIDIENAKRVGNKIQGTYYALESLNTIYRDRLGKNPRMLVLKKLTDDNGNEQGYVICTHENKVFTVKKEQFVRLINQGANFVNFTSYDGVKCKSQKIEITKVDKFSDVTDPSTIWDVQRFIDYMNYNNYEFEIIFAPTVEGEIKWNSARHIDAYTYTEYDEKSLAITHIDERCKQIKIPDGVARVEDLYKNPGFTIDSLIIPSFIDTDNIFNCAQITVDSGYSNKALILDDINEKSLIGTINKLHIQKADFKTTPLKIVDESKLVDGNYYEFTQLNLNGFKHLRINEITGMSNFGYITGGLKYCIVKDVDIRNARNVQRMFNNTRVESGHVRIDAEYISECLRFATNIQNIEINNVASIDSSFVQINTSPEFDGISSNPDSIKINFKAVSPAIRDSMNCIATNKDKGDLKYIIDKAPSKITKISINKIDVIENSFHGYHIVDLRETGLLSNGYMNTMLNSFWFSKIDNEFILPYTQRGEVTNFMFADAKFKYSAREGIDKTPYDKERIGQTACIISDWTYSKNSLKHLIPVIDLKNQFKVIGCNAFSNTGYWHIQIKLKGISTIQKLESDAFYRATMYDFDTRECNGINTIPNGCFEEARIQNIFIGNTVKIIESEAFRNLNGTKKVFIAPSVDTIGGKAFQSDTYNTTFIVVEGSKAHKELKKHYDIPLIVVKSYEELEELWEKRNGAKVSSEEKANFLAKQEIFNNYPELTPEMFANHYKEIINILDTLDTYEDNVRDIKEIKLHLDLNGVPLSDLSGTELYKHIMKMSEIIDTNPDVVNTHEEGKLPTEFVGLCNLYSNYIPQNRIKLFSKSAIKHFWNLMTELRISCLSYASNCSIWAVDTAYKEKSSLSVFIVILDNKIVFAAPYNREYMRERVVVTYEGEETQDINNHVKSIMSTQNLGYKKSADIQTIMNMIKPGDNIMQVRFGADEYTAKECTLINSVRIPSANNSENIAHKYDILNKVVSRDWVILSETGMSSFIFNKENRHNSEHILTIKLALYSLKTDKVIVAKCNVKAKRELRYQIRKFKVDKLMNANIIKIFDKASSRGSYNGISTNYIKKAFNDIEILSFASYMEQDLDKVNNEDIHFKYDGSKSKELSVASKLIDEHTSNPELLTEDEAKALVYGRLTIKAGLTMRNLINTKIAPPLETPLRGTDKKILQWKISDNPVKVQYAIAVGNSENYFNDTEVRLSYKPIATLLGCYKVLATPLEDMELHTINVKTVNIGDFVVLNTIIVEDGYRFYIPMELAVQKQTMEIFLLINKYDTDFMPLFRFKDLAGAEYFCEKFLRANINDKSTTMDGNLLPEGERAKQVRNLIKYIKDNYGSTDRILRNNELSDMHERIICGASENFRPPVIMIDVWNLIAK